ncbi:MAG: CrcB family protein [Clostridia bacterium]
MELLLVAVGGAAGSVLRYFISKKIAYRSNFILATFCINLSGAFLLGIVAGIPLTGNLLLLCADGFLAAFTTFSTFLYEGFQLFHNKKRWNAVIYILGSLILGSLGFFFGEIFILIW